MGGGVDSKRGADRREMSWGWREQLIHCIQLRLQYSQTLALLMFTLSLSLLSCRYINIVTCTDTLTCPFHTFFTNSVSQCPC